MAMKNQKVEVLEAIVGFLESNAVVAAIAKKDRAINILMARSKEVQ